uniref:Transcriptional regulator n=1 Tax=Haemonchus contortus TaxID=6289 RepID=A0A7I4YIZ5_HAECO
MAGREGIETTWDSVVTLGPGRLRTGSLGISNEHQDDALGRIEALLIPARGTPGQPPAPWSDFFTKIDDQGDSR